MPSTWRKVAENQTLTDGYRLDWRYEAPEGSRGGTAQQISLSAAALDRSQLVSLAPTILAKMHHNVGLGALYAVNRTRHYLILYTVVLKQ